MKALHAILLTSAAIIAGSVFLRPRVVCGCASRASACIANLNQLQAAKDQWALDHPELARKRAPSFRDLVGAGKYLKAIPVCSENGHYYLNTIGKHPECLGARSDEPHALPD